MSIILLRIGRGGLGRLLEQLTGSKTWAAIGLIGLCIVMIIACRDYRDWKIYKKIMKDKAKRANEIAPDPDAPFPQEAFATDDSPAQTKPDESLSSQVDQAQRGLGQDPPVKK